MNTGTNNLSTTEPKTLLLVLLLQNPVHKPMQTPHKLLLKKVENLRHLMKLGSTPMSNRLPCRRVRLLRLGTLGPLASCRMSQVWDFGG